MSFADLQDPRWTEAAASLRKGVLYVKLPRQKTAFLVHYLNLEGKDLLRKGIAESDKSFVFYGPTADWEEDLLTLKELKPTVIVIELIRAIEAGLNNEKRMDWISRVGGPPRREIQVLELPEGEDTLG